jgi:hypothetical protein
MNFLTQYQQILGWATCMADTIRLSFAADVLAQRFDTIRLRLRATERVMELVSSFCTSQILGKEPVPCTLLVGNYAWKPKKRSTFPFKRFLRLLGKCMRVVVVDEFHTSACCFFCGQKAGYLKCRDGSDNIGVKACQNHGCSSLGRAMDRDETGVLNIVARFVLIFVGGAYVGGYSWWGWNGVGQSIPETEVVSLFHGVMCALPDDGAAAAAATKTVAAPAAGRPAAGPRGLRVQRL